jgi:hypothetical protein
MAKAKVKNNVEQAIMEAVLLAIRNGAKAPWILMTIREAVMEYEINCRRAGNQPGVTWEDFEQEINLKAALYTAIDTNRA